MDNKCIVCLNDQWNPIYESLLKCDCCGFVTADIEITDNQLKDIYEKNYFFGEEYSNYLVDKYIIQKNLNERLNDLKKIDDKLANKNLIEIGCAYGFFLDLVKQYFASEEGFDVSLEAVDYANTQLNVNANSMSFLDKTFLFGEYILCMWDTIEHLKNPDKFINHFSNFAAKGSLIAITTGDISSINAKFRKEKWRLIHPPSHLHYFSKKTLCKLLERNGFQIIHAKHVGFHRSVDLLLNSILNNKTKDNKYKLIYFPEFIKRLSFYVNLFDIIYIIGIKR
jgi:2-polyprenyl-3-methyl-5-hydroxy-6-metoxy-1,4-benzoquinol methylase